MKSFLGYLLGLAIIFVSVYNLYNMYIGDMKKENDILQEMLQNAGPPQIERSMFSYKVKYTLTNHSDETFDYIQLNADMFDANGVKLDNKWTNITNITPGQTFELLLWGDQGTVRHKVTGIYSSAH